MSANPGIWLAAACTLAIYSFLYGDNPIFKFAEHAFVGLGAAHAAVMGVENMLNRAWDPFFKRGEWWLLGALVGGVMLLTRWFQPIRWISRIPLGFMMGVAAGLSARRAIDSEFWKQIISTVGMKLNTVNNVIYVVMVICTLAYFLFAFNDKTSFGSGIKSVGLLGQYMMMIAFGASLGATIMARLSLVIARLDFLFRNWLGVLH
ncbi:MAG: hypothetical protein A2Y96_02025 [Firmicutes bacterium RBG_13_65_8]|nr:MAG: hypothetical protein A2Y96_02025 [Firmicutes bacterium RBG_13_65_8]